MIKIRHSRRPHDNPLRNQVNRGIQKAQIPEHRLRQRISHEACVGADRRILINLLLPVIHHSIADISHHGAQHLDQNRNEKDLSQRTADPGNAPRLIDKGPHNIAGQNDIQNQIRQAFSSFLCHDADASDHKSRQHEEQHLSHQLQHLRNHILNVPSSEFSFSSAFSFSSWNSRSAASIRNAKPARFREGFLAVMYSLLTAETPRFASDPRGFSPHPLRS